MLRLFALTTLLLTAADHWTTYLCLHAPVDGWAVSEANPTPSTLADAWREDVVRENPSFRGVQWDRSADVTVTTLDALIEAFA